MKKSLPTVVVLLTQGSARILAAGQTEVLNELSKNYVLAFDAIVYVEDDGGCKDGQVIKVIGGKKTEGIPRKYACVKRPN
jgi:hypothetical protein